MNHVAAVEVSALERDALDRWVARALGMSEDTVRAAGGGLPSWSGDWKVGGPLVDRYGITIDHSGPSPRACVHEDLVIDGGECGPQAFRFPRHGQDGRTGLEAAMRSLVASRFGPRVPA